MIRKNQPTHCSNCNKLGHYFRECRDPVTSYGIIAFRVNDGDITVEPAVLNNVYNSENISAINPEKIEILMIRRKDTLGYIEFMRGKYNIVNTDYIQSLFNQMTTAELEKITNTDFESLWNSLWDYQISRQYKQEYEHALEKYNLLKLGIIEESTSIKKLSEYIESASREWTTPEWGFPKGRRSLRESEISCALREFSEETGLNESQCILIKNLMPLEENFLGGNRIQYRHRYFLAYCRQSTHVKFDSMNKIMNREISDIKWMSYKDAMDLIRPYNIEKRQILSVVNEILSNYIILPGREYLKLGSASPKKGTSNQIIERDVNKTNRDKGGNSLQNN
jgi:8-oxo-dGTP pyrophosphatase MutT (NUDIX family)